MWAATLNNSGSLQFSPHHKFSIQVLSSTTQNFTHHDPKCLMYKIFMQRSHDGLCRIFLYNSPATPSYQLSLESTVSPKHALTSPESTRHGFLHKATRKTANKHTLMSVNLRISSGGECRVSHAHPRSPITAKTPIACCWAQGGLAVLVQGLGDNDFTSFLPLLILSSQAAAVKVTAAGGPLAFSTTGVGWAAAHFSMNKQRKGSRYTISIINASL